MQQEFEDEQERVVSSLNCSHCLPIFEIMLAIYMLLPQNIACGKCNVNP